MFVDDLAHDQKTLVTYRFYFHKAKYTKDLDASKPIFVKMESSISNRDVILCES